MYVSQRRRRPDGSGGEAAARENAARRVTRSGGGRGQRQGCGQDPPTGEVGARGRVGDRHCDGVPRGVRLGRLSSCCLSKRGACEAVQRLPGHRVGRPGDGRDDGQLGSGNLALMRRAMRRFEPAAAGCGDCAHPLPSLLLRFDRPASDHKPACCPRPYGGTRQRCAGSRVRIFRGIASMQATGPGTRGTSSRHGPRRNSVRWARLQHAAFPDPGAWRRCDLVTSI